MSEIGDIVREELDKTISALKRSAASAGKVVTGKTVNSLERVVNDFANGADGQIWGASWFGTLETGRRPAKQGGSDYEKQQFIRGLMQWCRVRGIKQELNDEQLYRFANYLRWRINTFGSALYRSGGRKDIITPAIEDAEVRLTNRLSEFVLSYTNRMFNK